MKSSERVKKLRDMSVAEIEQQGIEMSEQMFRNRFQFAMGQTEALKKTRELRRDLARVKTILREKSVAGK